MDESKESLSIVSLTSGFEGFLCGIFSVLASVALYLFLIRRGGSTLESARRRRVSTFSRPLVLGTVLLLLLIVAHWVCTMARNATVLSLVDVGRSATEIESGVAYFRLAKLGIVACVGIVADGLLMWRLWIVSNQSRIAIAPPIISSLVFSGLAIGMTPLLARYPLRHEMVRPWVIASGSSVMVTNLYCTVTLAYYISRIQSRTVCIDKSKMARLLALTIESAGLWTAWYIFMLVSFLSGSPLVEFAFHGCPAVAGIACILINVRVGLGRDTQTASTTRIPLRIFRFPREEDVDAGVNIACSGRKATELVESVPGEMDGPGGGKPGASCLNLTCGT
ncbi:hypothetical protein FA15DRAFT_692484 [Coprinopsis marcescibilis]|uniref:G-protein coupled receptors family 3 profile domain-containing protein n=1 Tax=Coprinopsis marcescibilis TaxID=230819 RepID=A0A5C3L3X3_COPMA|nr:hypothetical protein FA15DRAFT_692484 [Coprinopsis marcescibilis]